MVTMPKKSEALKFIQDMKLANNVIIKNMEFGSVVDEIGKVFVGHAIYSSEDWYLDYDQFQLIEESRDLTTMKTPLNLVHKYILPQGATNFVAHM